MAVGGGWQEAVTAGGRGVFLEVEVSPGASESRFPSGHNPWRGTLLARLRAPPEKGKANEELVGLVAEALGVAGNAISIESGATARRKRLLVRGLDRSAALERLRPLLETPP